MILKNIYQDKIQVTIFFIVNNVEECEKQNLKIKSIDLFEKLKKDKDKDKEKFIFLCNEIIDKSSIYDKLI